MTIETRGVHQVPITPGQHWVEVNADELTYHTVLQILPGSGRNVVMINAWGGLSHWTPTEVWAECAEIDEDQLMLMITKAEMVKKGLAR